MPDERSRLEAKVADLYVCLRAARTKDVRDAIREAIVLIEGHLAALAADDPVRIEGGRVQPSTT